MLLKCSAQIASKQAMSSHLVPSSGETSSPRLQGFTQTLGKQHHVLVCPQRKDDICSGGNMSAFSIDDDQRDLSIFVHQICYRVGNN